MGRAGRVVNALPCRAWAGMSWGLLLLTPWLPGPVHYVTYVLGFILGLVAFRVDKSVRAVLTPGTVRGMTSAPQDRDDRDDESTDDNDAPSQREDKSWPPKNLEQK